jgi:hypothetical protein
MKNNSLSDHIHDLARTAVVKPANSKAEKGAVIASEQSMSQVKRLTERLQGLLRNEIAEHGGTDTFMRWIRSEEGEDAA